ncbi:MAG TPA: hypothetical protein VFE32_19195 [Puia sp.]|jgi:hypothetical protein|nr:hypothetical protein [Puia sp.]
MSNFAFDTLENEMVDFDFAQMNQTVASAKSTIAKATTAAELGSAICSVWAKVRKYVVWASNLPILGKFIKPLIEVLDVLCPQVKG